MLYFLHECTCVMLPPFARRSSAWLYVICSCWQHRVVRASGKSTYIKYFWLTFGKCFAIRFTMWYVWFSTKSPNGTLNLRSFLSIISLSLSDKILPWKISCHQLSLVPLSTSERWSLITLSKQEVISFFEMSCIFLFGSKGWYFAGCWAPGWLGGVGWLEGACWLGGAGWLEGACWVGGVDWLEGAGWLGDVGWQEGVGWLEGGGRLGSGGWLEGAGCSYSFGSLEGACCLGHIDRGIGVGWLGGTFCWETFVRGIGVDRLGGAGCWCGVRCLDGACWDAIDSCTVADLVDGSCWDWVGCCIGIAGC